MTLRRRTPARLLIALAIPAAFLAAPAVRAATDPAADARAGISEQYARLPIVFEANRGQSAAEVRYQARGVGYGFFLTDRETVLNLDGMADGKPVRSTIKTRLVGAATAPAVVGEGRLDSTTHYLTGASKQGWKTGIEQFGKVRYQGVYPGVDVVYYGTQSQVEFDYVVAPGADPSAIVMEIDGARSIRLDARGDLVLATATGELVQQKPVIFQDIDGRRVPVDGRYKVSGQRIAFEVAEYDRSRTLVIDPLLAFNLYAPGVHREIANAIAIGGDGSAYIAGYSTPYDYARRIRFISDDVFITKLNPSGTAIEYATYVGGAADDRANAIAVDASGAVHVTGDTTSNDFPVVAAVQDRRAGFRDGFALKLTPDGRDIVYSTYLGGVADDTLTSLALGASGRVVIGGVSSSLDYPVQAALQAASAGRADAVVTALNLDGSLAYSTYLGGSDDDGISGIAVDTNGAAVVTGFSRSFDLPSTPGAVQPARTPNIVIPDDPGTLFNEAREDSYSDAFAARLAPGGATLDYLTYLGGRRDDVATGVALDSNGNAYIAGYTQSTNFPLLNPYSSTLKGGNDVFVSKLNSDGTALVYSTLFGGESFSDYSTGIAVDASGRAWVTGYTFSISMPTLTPLQRANSGAEDAFVFGLAPAGNALAYASYLGAPGRDFANGIALDGDGNVYLTGYTFSTNFTTTRAPVQGASFGRGDPFVTKFETGGSALAYSTYLGETNVFLSLALGDRNRSRTGPAISLPLPLRGIIGCTLRAVDGFVLAGTGLLFPTRVVCGGEQEPPG
jgi:hypothetical protein